MVKQYRREIKLYETTHETAAEAAEKSREAPRMISRMRVHPAVRVCRTAHDGGRNRGHGDLRLLGPDIHFSTANVPNAKLIALIEK